MKKILLIIFLINLLSCASNKWKIKYTETQVKKLKSKYSVPIEFNFAVYGNMLINKPFKKLTRSDIKKNILAFERVFAIIPDSQSIKNGIVDSFYYTKNKVQYIKKNKLQTLNIHLTE